MVPAAAMPPPDDAETARLRAQGERLRAAREAAGLSLRELSDACGAAHTTLLRAERGLQDLWTGQMLRAAQALGVSVAWLTTGEE